MTTPPATPKGPLRMDGLDAIRQRLEAATPGPWRWGRAPDDERDWPEGHLVTVAADRPSTTGPPLETVVLGYDCEASDADREFIAHARTDVERLLTIADAALTDMREGWRPGIELTAALAALDTEGGE